MVRLRLTSEVESLIIHNIPALVLLVLMVLLYDILDRFMFRIPIGIGTSLSIMLFLILVSTAMVLLMRVYVRERIITCKRANELVGGVAALLYITAFSAISFQSSYAVMAAVLMGIALGFGLYMTVLVDVATCQKIPSVVISIIEPQVEFSRGVLVRDKVTVGSGKGNDVTLPAKVGDVSITLINNKGNLIVTGKGLMIEDKGVLKGVDSVALGIDETRVIWIGNVRIRITRLS